MSGVRYRIEYSEQARENIKRFPKNIQKRILNAIEERLIFTPEKGKPLTRDLKHHYRLRVGDYRVIYKIWKDRIVVFIVDIDNRKNVYE